MELNDYLEEALKTEISIDAVNINKEQLKNLLMITKHTMNMLNVVKRNVFYKEDIDNDYILEECYKLNETMQGFVSHNTKLDAGDEYPIDDGLDLRIFHAIFGVICQSRPLSQLLLDALEQNHFDLVKIRQELSDSHFFQALFYNSSGMDWNRSLELNLESLRKKYPNEYNEDHIKDD